MATETPPASPTPSAQPRVEITQEDYDLLQKFKQQNQQPPTESRPDSPKRQKLDDDLQTFVDALAEREIDWMELDPQLRHRLQTDAEARRDFQLVQLTPDAAKAYDPEKKSFTTVNLSKKRIFSDQEKLTAETPTLTIPEESIKAAMIEYHSQTVLPNMDKLWKTCAEFYANTVMESQYVQLHFDLVDTRLRSLEQSRSNKTVLIRGLPAFGYSRSALEKNVRYFLSKASLDFSCVAAMHTHLVSSSSSIMRLELTTEEQRRQLFQAMRTSKQMWRLPIQQQDQYHEEKAKVEQDLPTDERIALQPYYTMMDILQKIGPAGANGELQTDRNTLQIWGDKAQAPCPLLSQVCYLLDHRFARRYVCVVFVAEAYYEETLARWHEAFSSRMRTTLMLVQALQRAVGDKTTVARHSWNKAFDLANIPDPQLHFEYPLIPLSMSSSLAALLEKHPSLPLQGASGLLATVSQVFQDYGVQVEDYGKGSSKGALRDKGSDSPKKKGKSKGVKPWSNWQDRAPDQSKWQWRRDDDHQDRPSGPSWPAKFGSTWTNWSARPTGKGRSTAKGSSRGGRSWDFMLCQICLCALGVNLDCRECSKYEAPPGTAKQPAPVKTVWCPGIAPDGSICNARLGFGDCSLCRAHVDFWKYPQSDSLTVSPYRLAEIYQVDRILYDYDLTKCDPEKLQHYIQELRHRIGETGTDQFTTEQWSFAWILRVLAREHHFLPLLQSSVLPFEINPKQTEEYLHNAGCDITTLIRDHFATLDYFAFLFEELWQQEWESLTSHWELQDEIADLNLITAAVTPWDSMVASSLQLAFEELEQGELLHSKPGTKLTRDLFDLLGASLAADDFSPFESVLHRFADWLMHSDFSLDVFLGRNLYSNETLKSLSAFATAFTDVCFWQISRAYMVHTAKKPKAQHQVPNEALNFLYDKFIPLLHLPREDAQWALTQRHFNNKGNSLEVLLFSYAEEGSHGDYWQLLWVLFMYQYKDARFPWIVQVL